MRFNLLTSFYLILSLAGASAFAKVTNTNNEAALISHLEQVASNSHHSVSYSSARKDLLGDLYLERTNNTYFITDVYCEKEYRAPGPGKVPNNAVINVEHTWPQSKFGGRDRRMQKSDLHHLFPTDSELNSIRGNHPFGIVEQPTKVLKCQTSKIGRNAQGQLVFEPPAAHKGNVARALFYFSIRYGLKIDATQEAVLRQWHEEDPVDYEEIERNTEISQIQGNINPFIEHPEYVNAISDF
ncbi:MAG: endonuclease [Chitinophagaceae bacterium]|nr:endonuclease [Chitinophagaceae bacterium]